MTKEEAIDILHKMSEDNFYGTHVQEACKMAIEALSPRPKSQEDIIYQAIQEVCHVDNPRRFAEYNQTVFEVAKKVLEISKPSLPSNLDEAAVKAHIKLEEEGNLSFLNIFKAGAEWMAGQGVTKDAIIGMATEEISVNVSQHTLDELDVCPGDKVIIQIRKK